jgi:hypothetical protein
MGPDEVVVAVAVALIVIVGTYRWGRWIVGQIDGFRRAVRG